MQTIKISIPVLAQNVYITPYTVPVGYSLIISGVFTGKVEADMEVRFRTSGTEAVVLRHDSVDNAQARIVANGYIVKGGEALQVQQNSSVFSSVVICGQLVEEGPCA